MVGRSSIQSAKGAMTTLQWDDDLHDVKYLEGKKHQGKAMDARQVAFKAKEDINMRSRALNNPT